jgi:acyl-coenzyme A thioesterase PaaI-like protein
LDPKDSPVREVKGILVVGEGMNGFMHTLHGGIVATILDEIMGIWVNVNMMRRAFPLTWWMTAYLNTTFVKPVATPNTLLTVARLVKLDGRKLLLEGTIEDGEGVVLAKGEGLFVGLKPRM